MTKKPGELLGKGYCWGILAIIAMGTFASTGAVGVAIVSVVLSGHFGKKKTNRGGKT